MGNLFLQQLKKYREDADVRISYFFDKEIEKSSHHKRDLKLLQDYVLRDGKRIRGYLFCLSHRFFKEKLNESVLNFSIGHELGHAGLLIQDDIFDKSETRRKKKAFHLLLGAKGDLRDPDEANKKAIFLSDVLIGYGYKLFLNSKIKINKKIKALAYLNKQALRTAAGEMLDLDYTDRQEVLSSDIKKMSLLKTASYTTLAPMVMGSIVAGARDSEISQIEKIATGVGELFQMRDDYLDVFGTKEEIGKEIRRDEAEKKQTYMTKYLKNTSKSEMKKIFIKKLQEKKELILKDSKIAGYFSQEEFGEFLNFLVKRKK